LTPFDTGFDTGVSNGNFVTLTSHVSIYVENRGMNTMKLSEHMKDGRFAGYKKYIHGRNFHLGMDRQRADKIARALLARAQTLEATGGVWTDAIIEECYAPGEPARASVPNIVMAPQRPPASALPTSGKSFHEVLDLFEAHSRLRWQSKQIADASFSFVRLHVGRVKRDIPNRPMSSIEMTGLRELIAHYAQRPMVFPPHGSLC
jgi:hypothetical protein